MLVSARVLKHQCLKLLDGFGQQGKHVRHFRDEVRRGRGGGDGGVCGRQRGRNGGYRGSGRGGGVNEQSRCRFLHLGYFVGRCGQVVESVGRRLALDDGPDVNWQSLKP